ncbi:MAG: hypothetical protein QG575_287 [Euryarchaeota archaeon]|nr:hypothetical protein [Euryarchaeota archaeon]
MADKNQLNYQKVKDFWDKSAMCSSYADDIQTGMLSQNKHAAYYRKCQEEAHFEKLIKLNKKMKILEVGCGTGRWAFYFADKVAKIVAIDLSDKMIEIAKKKQMNSCTKNIDFHCLSAMSFETNEKFDLVYFSGVLQYIEDKDIDQILDKLPEWMNKDGLCLSRDTLSLQKRFSMTEDYPVIYRTKKEYEEMFKKHGLKLVYQDKSYNNSISSSALIYYINKYVPKCSMGTLIALTRIARPFDDALKFIFEKKNGQSWDHRALNDKISHDFLLYKFNPDH